MLVRKPAGLVAIRIDMDDLRAVASGRFQYRDKMRVGSQDINAPKDYQLGMCDVFGIG